MKTKAFSLVELLMTLALLGVAVGVLLVGYGNLREIFQTTAQNRDQTVLYQAISAFNLMGGDMAPIFNSGLSKDEQAAVLTKVMQNSASAAMRKQKGVASDMVGEDMVVVPIVSDKGIAMLQPLTEGKRTTLQVVTTTAGLNSEGFVVVTKDSPLGGQSLAVDTWNVSKGSAQKIENTAKIVLSGGTFSGARYADNRGNRVASKYVWNEDEASRTGPGGDTLPTYTGVNIPTPTRLKYEAFYPSDLTFSEYTNPDEASGKGLKLLQFSREDGGPISAAEIDLSQITLAGKPLDEKGMRLVQATGAGGKPVVSLYITLNEIYPATDWTQDVTSLVVKAKPTALGKKGGKDRSPLVGEVNDQLLIHAKKEPLKEVAFLTDMDGDSLKSGNTVQVAPQDDSLPLGWAKAELDDASLASSPANNVWDFFKQLVGDPYKVTIKRN